MLLDAFMLKRLAAAHPRWGAELRARIEAGAYDRIVLTRRIDTPGPWFRDLHFGPALRDAIARGYTLLDERRGFAVYRPVTRSRPQIPLDSD